MGGLASESLSPPVPTAPNEPDGAHGVLPIEARPSMLSSAASRFSTWYGVPMSAAIRLAPWLAPDKIRIDGIERFCRHTRG